MGRRTQAFKARFAPVVTLDQRGLTWPLLKKLCTPLNPPVSPLELSIATDGYQSPLAFSIGDIKSAVSVAEDCVSVAEEEASTVGTAPGLGETTTTAGETTTTVGKGTASEDESSTEEDGTVKRKRRHRGRRGKAWVPPAAPNHFIDRPCEHNSWDNVRVKKDKTTLRCRICQLQWKVDHVNLREGAKCQEFHAHGRCSKGDRCHKIHVHRCKLNLTKRQAIWGDELLKPHAVPDICAPCEEPAAPPLNVACARFDPRTDTTATDASYPLATPQVATPQGLGHPRVFRRESCTSASSPSNTTTTNASTPLSTSGLRIYTHNPYDLQLCEQPFAPVPQLISPVSSTLPDLGASRSSMPSSWTAGHSSPTPTPHSRKGSVAQSLPQRRTSTTSGSAGGIPSSPPAVLYQAAAQAAKAPQATKAAQAAHPAVLGYYQPCHLQLAVSALSGGAEAGARAPIPSPASERRGSSETSNGTVPVPHNVASLPTARLSRYPPAPPSSTKKSWADEIGDMWEDEEVTAGWLPDSAFVSN